MENKPDKKGLYATVNVPTGKNNREKEQTEVGSRAQRVINSPSDSSIEVKPGPSLNASGDGDNEGDGEEEEEEEEDDGEWEGGEEEGLDLESKAKPKIEENGNPPKIYSRVERIVNKFVGLISMLTLFTLVTLIYGTYLFWHLSPQLATSNVGPSIKFWRIENWEDSIYAKGMTSFLIIHILLSLFLVALYKSAFINPGNIPDDLKTPELDSNQIERVSEIANAYSFSSRVSEENSESEQEKIGDHNKIAKENLKDPSHFSFTTEEVNIQGNQGENIVKRSVSKEKRNELPKILNDANVSKKFKEAFLSIIKHSVEHKTKNGSFGKPRYCQTCRGYKPDRCHHCSACNKCILKMDHHCPFVNNCIGFNNYKYFMLMLFYSSIMLNYMIFTMFEAVRFVVNELQASFWSIAFIITVYTTVILLWGLVTCFMFFHFWMIFKGLTTIEFREKLMKKYETSPYDVGVFENFKLVFGKNPFLWILPFGVNHDGLGLKYKVKKEM